MRRRPLTTTSASAGLLRSARPDLDPPTRAERRWVRPLSALAVVTAVAVAATGCSPGQGRAEAATAEGSTVAAEQPGTTVRHLTVEGKLRSYRIHLPPAADDLGPLPLVVMLHGGLGSGQQAEESYGWDELADREGVAVAYPDGLDRSWAVSDDCCGPSGAEGVDDVAFIDAAVTDMVERHPIDTERIYVAGMSNGGMLAYLLACRSDRFAAVGAVATTLLGPCPSPDPLSVIHIHGTDDANVPYDGSIGQSPIPRADVHVDGPAIETLVAGWRRVDRCDEPTITTDGDVTVTSASCPEGRAVDLITIGGAGHQWPGSEDKPVVERVMGVDPPSDALDATDTLWRFFDRTS